MPAENLNITCPMCGYENRFSPDEIHLETEPGDRLSDETVVAQFAECHECGERIDVEAPDGRLEISSADNRLAFYVLAGIGLLFVMALVGMLN